MISSSSYTKPFSFEMTPVVLEGDRLRLEPLTPELIEELLPLFDPEIWRWYSHQLRDRQALKTFLQTLVAEQNSGRTLAFAIREKSGNALVGSTRFMNLAPEHRRVEIGSTWYAPKWQRTFVNTESKFLMLSHAFEKLECVSVRFQTDELNERSRRAIERLGAKLDGILRNDRICEDGRLRNSANYSITAAEWPAVRSELHDKMNRL